METGLAWVRFVLVSCLGLLMAVTVGLLPLIVERAEALEIRGAVRDPQGTPITEAMITVTGNPAIGATAITVFTDRTGAYQTPDLGQTVPTDNVQMSSRRIGFTQTGMKKQVSAEGILTADFVMTPVDNVADQVPPSAWIERLRMPESQPRQIAMLLCGDCHALPGKETRAIASSFHHLSQTEREQAWRDIVRSMRRVFTRYFAEEGAVDAQFSSPTDNEIFIDQKDEMTIAAFLAEHLPTKYDTFPRAEWEACCKGAPVGIKGTVIREYALPVDQKSWTREVVAPKGSRHVWGVDKTKNKLFRLDPDDGSLQWYPVPGDHPGPHTLFPDADGNIWVSLEDEGKLARFDPRTTQWQVWPAFVDAQGKVLLTHDPARNAHRQVGFDYQGRVWVTLISHNKLGSLDPKTGERKIYDVPLPKNKSAANAVLYGLAMTSDGRHVWWTQIQGNLGSFNTETLQVEEVVEFPMGTGPRRLAVDDQDVLWVPLYGASQLLAYDTKARKELARYDMPDRSAASYNVTWDPVRKVVWCGSMNANKIYRFNPGTKQWTQYLMPRDDARFRVVPLDDQGNIWGTYATFPGNLDRATMVMMLKPGEPDLVK